MGATLAAVRTPCQDDPEAFWPQKVWAAEGQAQIARAQALCAGCPVRVPCLAEALTLPRVRVAGSVTGGVYHSTRGQRPQPEGRR
jgi:transcription factor WhiB